jgi:hypothetical protein
VKKILFATVLLLTELGALYAYEPAAAENIFPYQTAVVKDSPAAPLVNPSLLPFAHGVYLSSSFARPYSVGDLNAAYVKGGLSYDGFGISCGWTRFGIKEYYEDRFLAGGGFSPAGFISFGAEGFMKRNVISTEVIQSKTKLYDGTLFLTLVPNNFMRIGFRQDNIVSIYRRNRRDLLYPDTSFGFGVVPVKGVFASWNYTRTFNGGINTWEFTADLLKQFSVSAGYSRETSTYGFSGSLALNRISFSYGISYHAYLGTTHRAGITLSTDIISFKEIDAMQRRLVPDTDKGVCVDLTSCTLEELCHIHALTAMHAERLIKFREIIGPISDKSLRQMGLSNKEIEEVENHSVGLVYDDPSQKKKTDEKRFSSMPFVKRGEVRKALFIRLVEGGIPPARALKVSDLAMQKPIREVIAAIDSIEELSADEKQKAKAICAQ